MFYNTGVVSYLFLDQEVGKARQVQASQQSYTNQFTVSQTLYPWNIFLMLMYEPTLYHLVSVSLILKQAEFMLDCSTDLALLFCNNAVTVNV